MARMAPPRSGVKVRMYRQGHGDCFLLAFAGRDGRRSRPLYVLIDCGLKNGSEVDGRIDEIIDDIHAATEGHIDIVVVTHEHLDHVNGFSRGPGGAPFFDRIDVGQVWLAWTEDGADELANALRERFGDTLIALAFAEERMQARPGLRDEAELLADLLETETGQSTEELRAAFTGALRAAPDAASAALSELAIAGVTNKRSIAWLRDKARDKVVFLDPEGPPLPLPFVQDAQVFTLGPPRDAALLLDLDPQGAEKFDLHRSGLSLDGASRSLALALQPVAATGELAAPFAPRHCIEPTRVFGAGTVGDAEGEHYRRVYGDGSATHPDAWRYIEDDWLQPAEAVALRLNNEVNNTSLVLAFALPKSGKVLLFSGDAQRGSWIGWSDLAWTSPNGRVTARDLLARSVLYKVGHHGSHNATLNGHPQDAHANLGWMAQGDAAREFVAMIPANTAWAMGKSRPWAHPMPEIEAALHRKAGGRVLRSDLGPPTKPATGRGEDWRDFQRRLKHDRLYFELTIPDT